jgi:hypothetical protein
MVEYRELSRVSRRRRPKPLSGAAALCLDFYIYGSTEREPIAIHCSIKDLKMIGRPTMAPGPRRSDKRIKSPARLSRMKDEYLEAWPTFRSRQIWARVTPDLAADIEAERSLYAIPTSLSEVVKQLCEEAIAWRKANRPRTSGAFKPPRRVAFQID